MCNIAILEGFSLYSSGLKSILQNTHDFDVIAEAVSASDLCSKIGDRLPHVVIIDIIHGDNSGIKPIRKIRRRFPKVPVLLIVSPHYSDCFEEYIRLGVKGFIFNNSDGTDFIKAIKKLKNGEEYFEKTVWNIFKTSIQSRKYTTKTTHKLTDREVSVLKLFSRGLTYKEIGASLNISPRTVETHKRNILSKLKINSTADMVKYAYRNHIIA
ncbi:response regulator transcription factor [Prolixibacteraceae bacterium Z1-6]|uniref:Response regulator transcription factor n=1 Tax=Draconibacterium aestuarii TaxID=2998507 RepID=A0A9X3F2C8_9BACT|nr:response regulator transcription factor [Prolixibacteraceae bacterium Z1-6]